MNVPCTRKHLCFVSAVGSCKDVAVVQMSWSLVHLTLTQEDVIRRRRGMFIRDPPSELVSASASSETLSRDPITSHH